MTDEGKQHEVTLEILAETNHTGSCKEFGVYLKCYGETTGNILITRLTLSHIYQRLLSYSVYNRWEQNKNRSESGQETISVVQSR